MDDVDGLILGPVLALVIIVEHLFCKNMPNLVRYTLGGLAVGGAQLTLVARHSAALPWWVVAFPWVAAGLWTGVVYGVDGGRDQFKAWRARRRAAATLAARRRDP